MVGAERYVNDDASERATINHGWSGLEMCAYRHVESREENCLTCVVFGHLRFREGRRC